MSETRSSRRPLAAAPVPTVTDVGLEGDAEDEVVAVAPEDLPSQPEGPAKEGGSGVLFKTLNEHASVHWGGGSRRSVCFLHFNSGCECDQ